MTSETPITLTPAIIEQHMRHSRQLRSAAFLNALQGIPRAIKLSAIAITAMFA